MIKRYEIKPDIKSISIYYDEVEDEKGSYVNYEDHQQALADVKEFARHEKDAIQYAVVSTIGGTVEGEPTKIINYLQRLRELVQIEKDFARAELSIAEAKREGVREFLEKIKNLPKCESNSLLTCFSICYPKGDRVICELRNALCANGKFIDTIIQKVEGL